MPSQDLTVQCTVNITRKDPVLVKARLRPPPPQHHHHHHHKCLQMEFTKKNITFAFHGSQYIYICEFY